MLPIELKKKIIPFLVFLSFHLIKYKSHYISIWVAISLIIILYVSTALTEIALYSYNNNLIFIMKIIYMI